MRAVNPVNPLSFDTTPATFSWHVGLPPDTTITLAETIIPDPADPALTLRLGFTGTDDLTNPIDLEFECRLDSDAVRDLLAASEYDLTDADARPAPLRGARRRRRRQRRPDARPATTSPSSRHRTRRS